MEAIYNHFPQRSIEDNNFDDTLYIYSALLENEGDHSCYDIYYDLVNDKYVINLKDI